MPKSSSIPSQGRGKMLESRKDMYINEKGPPENRRAFIFG